MYFLLEKILEELNGCQKIMLYGTGDYASKLYSKLSVLGINRYVCNFLVTRRHEGISNIDGIPVFEIADINPMQPEITLIVAVSGQYKREIENTLSEYSFQKVIFLSDYAVLYHDDIEMHLCSKPSVEVLTENIIDEYIYHYPEKLEQRQLLSDDINTKISKRNTLNYKEKQIVYILGEVSARAYKMIKALRENEYDIVILQYSQGQGYVSEKELDVLAIRKEIFSFGGEMILKALEYNPMIYLIDPPFYDCFFSYVLIKNKSFLGKIVFSPYEILKNCFVPVEKSNWWFEKYSLENADGIIWRYFAREYLEQKEGYVFKGKSIQYLDNCGGYILDDKVKTNEDKKIKICSVAGGPLASYLDETECAYVRLASWRSILRRLDGTCIYHVYIWDANDEQKAELNRMQEQYPDFEVFYHVRHEELIQRLAQYDYGAEFFTEQDIPPYPLRGDTLMKGLECTEGSYRYSVTNRYFDYLDAELPIITTLPEKLCEYLGQYDVIIPMNVETIDVNCLNDKKQYYKDRAREAKQELTASRQIHKLIDFLENLSI